jgi:hypothetical protein
MRAIVADTIVRTLQNLDPTYPRVSKEKKAELMELRTVLAE